MKDYTVPVKVTLETVVSDTNTVLQKTSRQLQSYGTVQQREVIGSTTSLSTERVVNMLFTLSLSPTEQHRYNSVKDYFGSVRRRWCQHTSRGSGQPWLSSDDSRLYSYQGSRAAIHKDITAHAMSLGVLLDRGTYVNHYESPDTMDSVELLMEHDRNDISFMPAAQIKPYQLRLQYSDLEKFAVVDDKESALYVYFHLVYSPRLSQSDTAIVNEKTNWQRKRSIPGCTAEVLGNSSVLRFSFKGKEARDSVRRALSRLRSRSNFQIFYSPIRTVPPSSQQTHLTRPDFRSFECQYALQCLLSRGFVVTDQLDSFFPMLTTTIDRYDESIHCKALFQVLADIDNNHFVDLNKVYEAAIRNFALRIDIDEDLESKYLPSTCRYVRRVVVTPSRLLFLQPELMFENRILRQFGEECCIRVVFRDENYHKLSSMDSSSQEIEDRIVSTLQSGVRVGERHYKFLACSNSQLRDHGCWLYARDDKGHTAASIRRWMGDFSQIKCVATYISRMGQCFSTSEESVAVNVAEGKVRIVNDIKGGIDPDGKQYCFSDGIGKISRTLAEQICEEIGRSIVPSAYQIRFGGSKGVVAIGTDFSDDEEMIEIRGSMQKFESNHSKIEVMSVTSPGRLYFNRQAITVLSGLEIPDKVFLKLQDQMLSHLAKMFLSEKVAVESLQKRARLSIKYKKLQRCGIAMTTEPFFKELLQAVYKSFIGEIRRRARFEIPQEYGRNMIGVLDETGTLRYGQVFIQYSKSLDKPQKSCQIHTGPVVVTKFPCYHPGDVRKFEAINVPALHHLIDCFVFPRQGPRPHPNEMAGSDLDGDEYFVTWLPELIFSRTNHPPMHFPTPKKKVVEGQVKLDDMIKFIAEYIQNDRLGPMSNAHLVMADQQKDGVFSDVCIQVAKLLAEAVDFAKTGYCPDLEKEHRPIRYPDFMGKRDKSSYRSNRCLGKLYRQCLAIEKVTLPNLRSDDRGDNVKVEVPRVAVDESMKYPGYCKYVEAAKISRDRYNHQLSLLMTQYGIESEAEALSGCVTKLNKRITERNERFDTEKIIRVKISNLRRVTRDEFNEECDSDDSQGSDEDEADDVDNSKLAKASAWYYVTYSEYNPKFLSFPWVVSDLLGQIKSLQSGPTPLTHDPLISEINRQLLESVHTDGDSFVDYLRHQDDVTESGVIKQYLVTYPCLISVVNILLKWAKVHDVIHGGVHSTKEALSRNMLLLILLDFALQNEYVDLAQSVPNINITFILFQQRLQRGECPEEGGLKNGKPANLFVDFLEYCSKLQYDKSPLSTKTLRVSNVTDEQAYRLGEAALMAFHHLAQSGNINNLVSSWVWEVEYEMSREISAACWILLSRNIMHYEKQIEEYSGAAVTLRLLALRGPPRGQLTAFGSIKSLDRIRDRIDLLDHMFNNVRFRYIRSQTIPDNFFTHSYIYEYSPYTDVYYPGY
ncbi:uncharacterized protein LOC144436934 [Glandiceps talaboti]